MTKISTEIDFVDLANNVTLIKQAVLGNGVKGLCERVTDLEKWERKAYKVMGFSTGCGIVLGFIIKNFIG